MSGRANVTAPESTQATDVAPHHVAHFDAEDALYAYLARLNEDGHHPEMATMDANGVGFLATLTDPDADHVHHVVTNEGGDAHCCNCDGCSPGQSWNPCAWRPTYPVVSLSQQSPATVWREIAKAEREEAERHAARIAKAERERGNPPALPGGEGQ